MLTTVSHPTYGVISYDENAWTGKKTILFDGIPLTKTAKNTYQLPATAETPALTVTVKGSYIGGVSLVIGDETIGLTQKATALDIILGIIPAVLFFSMIIGGAIGGALSAMIGMGLVMVMKTRKKVIHKVLICVGISAAILAIGIPMLLAILSQTTN